MPLFWRYLLKDYFKILILSLVCFICVLLVMRAQEIARFATLSSGASKVFLFTLYQIPYILPFALCISTLIGSMITMGSLTSSHEITAFRCAGISFMTLLTPVLLTSLFLCLLNFMIISEMAPRCRLSSSKMLYETAADNPLILFRKNKFLKIKDSYVDMHVHDSDDAAENVLLAFKDASSGKLSLFLAKSLEIIQNELVGKKISLISSIETRETFDDLLLENQESMKMQAKKLSTLLQKSNQKIRYEHLPTKLLILKHKSEKKEIKARKEFFFESTKRAFFTLCPLTFTLLGLSFGLQIGRNPKGAKLIKVSLYILMIFTCYLLAKALHKSPPLALALFILPHPLVFTLCRARLKKLERGQEA